jgi:hypothetical protein
MINDKFHAHNTRSSYDYDQYVHKIGIHSRTPTAAGGKFYNKLSVYIKETKDNPFKKKEA